MCSCIVVIIYSSHYLCKQAYTSQIVVMAMLALAIGSDAISSQSRREAIIDGLFELPCKLFGFFHVMLHVYSLFDG